MSRRSLHASADRRAEPDPECLVAMNAAGHMIAGVDDIPAGYEAWLVKFRRSKLRASLRRFNRYGRLGCNDDRPPHLDGEMICGDRSDVGHAPPKTPRSKDSG